MVYLGHWHPHRYLVALSAAHPGCSDGPRGSPHGGGGAAGRSVAPGGSGHVVGRRVVGRPYRRARGLSQAAHHPVRACPFSPQRAELVGACGIPHLLYACACRLLRFARMAAVGVAGISVLSRRAGEGLYGAGRRIRALPVHPAAHGRSGSRVHGPRSDCSCSRLCSPPTFST